VEFGVVELEQEDREPRLVEMWVVEMAVLVDLQLELVLTKYLAEAVAPVVILVTVVLVEVVLPALTPILVVVVEVVEALVATQTTALLVVVELVCWEGDLMVLVAELK
jgi:hypothetical protein